MRLSRVGSGSPVGRVIRVKGLTQVLTRLNQEIGKIEGASQEGLIRAADLIHKETEKGAFRVPIDLGNLRHSFFTVTASAKIGKGGGKSRTPEGRTAMFVGPKAGEIASGHTNMLTEMMGKAKALSTMSKGPFLIMGYSANYAMWVHEMMGAKFQRRGAGPKWFENAIKSKQGEILEIIKRNAKIR